MQLLKTEATIEILVSFFFPQQYVQRKYANV